MTLTPHMPSPATRRILLAAFLLQVLVILVCIGAGLHIYREFDTRLNRQITIQKAQSVTLARQKLTLDQRERDLHSAQDALARAYFNRGLELTHAGRFSDAAGVFEDGLRIVPGDPYIRRELVKAIIRTGDPQAAIRTALGPRGSAPMTPRDLVTVAIARCAAQDAPGAIAMLTASKLDTAHDPDVLAFCPATLLPSPGTTP